MKQATLLKVFIGIVLCYLQQTVMAQSKWQYGVYAGANMSKLSPQKLSENKLYPFSDSYKWTPSYNFGANIDVQIAKKLYIEGGINIISKNSNAMPKEIARVTRLLYNTNNEIERFNKVFYRTFNYQSTAFQIPLSLHLNLIQKQDFKTNIYAGFLWENLTSINIDVENTSMWDKLPPQNIVDEEAIYEKTTGYLPDYKTDLSYFSKSNIGSLLGVGCSYKKIGIDIGINSPIRNYTSVQYKNASITFNIRYQIK